MNELKKNYTLIIDKSGSMGKASPFLEKKNLIPRSTRSNYLFSK